MIVVAMTDADSIPSQALGTAYRGRTIYGYLYLKVLFLFALD